MPCLLLVTSALLTGCAAVTCPARPAPQFWRSARRDCRSAQSCWRETPVASNRGNYLSPLDHDLNALTLRRLSSHSAVESEGKGSAFVPLFPNIPNSRQTQWRMGYDALAIYPKLSRGFCCRWSAGPLTGRIIYRPHRCRPGGPHCPGLGILVRPGWASVLLYKESNCTKKATEIVQRKQPKCC